MKKIVLYTIQGCPYCATARNLLSTNKIDHEEVDITPDSSNWRDKLQKTSGGERSVPQVYIDGKYMGQDDELKVLIDSKEIYEIIK